MFISSSIGRSVAAILLLLTFAPGYAEDEVAAAVRRLSAEGIFAFGGVGFVGQTSKGELDFRVIAVQEKEVALAAFEKLVASGNPQAVAYGLSGIRRLNPDRFKELFPDFEKSSKEVEIMRGCIISKSHLDKVAGQIRRGDFDLRIEKDFKPTGVRASTP